MNKIVVSSSIEETKTFAKHLVNDLEGSNVIALIGELGSGKTTFSQGLGEVFGLKRMISPTYILLRQYRLSDSPKYSHLYHADLYRVSTPQEALDLGFPEIWSDPKNILLIEWPESVLELLPANTIVVNFEKTQDDKREITISKI